MEFPGPIPCARVSVPAALLDVIPIGDTHIGSSGCAEHSITEAVSEGQRPDALFISPGDLVDGVDLGDKRFSRDIAFGRNLADLVPDQFRRAVELLAPARGRIIGIMRGNHDQQWIERHGVEFLWQWFIQQLGTRDLGMSCFFDVAVWFNDPSGKRRKSGRPADRRVRFAAHHGDGGGRTYGGKLNAGLRWSDGTYGADVILFAHTHMMSGIVDPKLGANDDCSDYAARNQLTVWTGGFLRSYEKGRMTYPERKAMRPVAIGCPVIHIRPYPKRIRVEVG